MKDSLRRQGFGGSREMHGRMRSALYPPVRAMSSAVPIKSARQRKFEKPWINGKRMKAHCSAVDRRYSRRGRGDLSSSVADNGIPVFCTSGNTASHHRASPTRRIVGAAPGRGTALRVQTTMDTTGGVHRESKLIEASLDEEGRVRGGEDEACSRTYAEGRSCEGESAPRAGGNRLSARAADTGAREQSADSVYWRTRGLDVFTEARIAEELRMREGGCYGGGDDRDSDGSPRLGGPVETQEKDSQLQKSVMHAVGKRAQVTRLIREIEIGGRAEVESRFPIESPDGMSARGRYGNPVSARLYGKQDACARNATSSGAWSSARATLFRDDAKRELHECMVH
ncbi:hypothetical protein FB451DRAFT_1491719 [Mycena latifolia]|nr:hypothetical protein FB451DRAFT_1491719 [Mycena latifolia]